MIQRAIQSQIEKCLFKGKAVIIYGARQVGKTTMIREIQKKFSEPEVLYLNCDEPDFRATLTGVTSTGLKELIGRKKIIFIDEAQRVKNIGVTLKLFVDNFPDRQVVATGSSSLDLSNEIIEPLTGRKYEFQLFPFALAELRRKYSKIEINRLLEKRMIFGMYPEIVEKPDEAETLLKSLASSYLYKDVLQYQSLKRPDLLEKLLVALALQIGSEVSYTELANLLGVNKDTVANYIQLLEKAFVVFRLSPFSRNLRSELTKLRKIYFYDTGIRNALINNFNPLSFRQDIGLLWENFMISERMKRNFNQGNHVNVHFWRTHQQQEIDYLEERGGVLTGFEFKWKGGKRRAPQIFLDTYAGSHVEFIDSQNYGDFVGI
ncbi:ATP-binding protein [candidate division KSB1 bacterium]|nr:ATP-binding protein [candidate division KSB1 bacterium]